MPVRLSACLIVQDEERRLPGALASVAFCDEVVVVDGGSSDRTVELATAAGAKVVQSPWPGFAAQRNRALAAATGEWVLEIDADERVSPRLRASIERLLAQTPAPTANVAVCPLRNRFLGGSLGPSAKYPAYRTRLFRRAAYRHDESRHVHEGIEPRERPLVLDGDLEHELADTIGEALRDAWRYARLESVHVTADGTRAYVFGMVVRPLAKLAYRLLLDAGWRDGWRGAVKVGLDAGSDALVWAFALARAARGIGGLSPTGPPHAARARHFGRRPTGPAKVVALAGRGRPELAARAWLTELADAGVDVALICTTPRAPDDRLPGQRVRRLGPLRTMRALDVEMQLRTAHAAVPFGARARLVTRVLPGALRPSVAGVDAEAAPERALARLREAVDW